MFTEEDDSNKINIFKLHDDSSDESENKNYEKSYIQKINFDKIKIRRYSKKQKTTKVEPSKMLNYIEIKPKINTTKRHSVNLLQKPEKEEPLNFKNNKQLVNQVIDIFKKKKKNEEEKNMINQYILQLQPFSQVLSESGTEETHKILRHLNHSLKYEYIGENKIICKYGELIEKFYLILRGEVDVIVPKLGFRTGEFRREAAGAQVGAQFVRQARLAQAQAFGQERGLDDAHGDGLAVRHRVGRPVRVLVPFDGVGVGVAEVEIASDVLLVGILLHDLALDGCGRLDERREGVEVDLGLGEDLDGLLVAVALVVDDEGLEHLGGAGAELPGRQGLEHFRQDAGVDREFGDADHVLVSVQVDAGLAAHARVHLAEQGGGVVGVAHAALVDAGGEAHQVGGHAAAHGPDDGVAVGALGEKPAADGQHGVHRLVLFVGDDGQRGASFGDFERESLDVPVVDDVDAFLLHMSSEDTPKI